MKKFFLFFITLLSFLIFIPQTFAQDGEIFQAEVIGLSDQEVQIEGQEPFNTQTLRVKATSGDRKGESYTIAAPENAQVMGQNTYEQGDHVLVNVSLGPDNEEQMYVIDYVRTSSLFWMSLIFAFIVLLIGRKSGARALVMLALTFVVIMWMIVPLLLRGWNPLIVSTIGAWIILFLAIFGTEGWNKKSKVSFAAISVSLIFIVIISYLFTIWARLTGFANEEAMFVVRLAKGNINMQGLLLAGFIIGALGVLDDVVMSQVSMVKQFTKGSEKLKEQEVYKKAMAVGTDHINAIVNTLFLAYAGASLPLLLLFTIQEPPFLTWSAVINNEVIATEIVRTLVGSICLILSMPIATWMAVKAYVK